MKDILFYSSSKVMFFDFACHAFFNNVIEKQSMKTFSLRPWLMHTIN